MNEDGFLERLRKNRVDEEGFSRLMQAIGDAFQSSLADDKLPRLLVACLFEVPWEVENTVPNFSSQDENLGRRVSAMADELRMAIHDHLWEGLEEHYQ